MNLWLVLPVKPFHEGKSRLAGVLTQAQRANLNRMLMQHVLITAQSTNLFCGIVVVSRAQTVRAVAHQAGVDSIVEAGFRLNAALVQGRDMAMRRAADSLLVLPADLPLLTAYDLTGMVEQASATQSVVIAPSVDGGTSGLLLRPPDVMPFLFGTNSFERHQLVAQNHHVSAVIYRSLGLQTDIDHPAHLALLPERFRAAIE